MKLLERRHFVLSHFWGLFKILLWKVRTEDIDGFGLWLWGKHLDKLLSLSSAQKEVFSFPVPPAILSWCHGTCVLSTQFRCQHVDCFPVGEMCWECRQLCQAAFFILVLNLFVKHSHPSPLPSRQMLSGCICWGWWSSAFRWLVQVTSPAEKQSPSYWLHQAQ